MKPTTMIGWFMGGFYFDDVTGEFLDALALWRRPDGSVGYWRGGVWRKAIRVDPWELL